MVDIFVFGSNLAGRHGKGAARTARLLYGAVNGQGTGLQGLAPIARSYAIPTKDVRLRSLSLFQIKGYVDRFILDARANPHRNFRVTRIGCGLAGYKDEQIAPMFQDAPDNCEFDILWKPYLGDGYKYFTYTD